MNKMKLVGIGDLFIPCEYIERGMRLTEFGIETETVEWKLGGFDELQRINLGIETNGPDGFEPPEYILERLRGAEILITQFFPVNKAVLKAANKLKYIGVLRAGFENVDIKASKEAGITVFHTPGRNAESVSDFAVGLMICEARNIARGHFGIKTGKWIREYPNSVSIPDFAGRTVGIIGYGEIGRHVARKLGGFGVKILVYDPFVRDIETVSLERLMSESDFVTLHARLTDDNYHMISEHELSIMKPTAYLINTSRSGLVDEGALYNALSRGKIAGAALDVFEIEPPGIDNPLVTLPNVTLTPHMAGGSQDAFRNTPKKLADDMRKLFAGQPEQCKFIIK